MLTRFKAVLIDEIFIHNIFKFQLIDVLMIDTVQLFVLYIAFLWVNHSYNLATSKTIYFIVQ